MTPMVDLGFLLISFFVITTELSKPKSMDLYMPHDGPPTNSAASQSITFLPGNDNTVFYYFGEEKDAIKGNAILPTSWNEIEGIGKIIRTKQMQLDKTAAGRSSLVVLIKPTKGSTYKNAIDILDEMLINGVTRYAVVKPGPLELQYLEKTGNH